MDTIKSACIVGIYFGEDRRNHGRSYMHISRIINSVLGRNSSKYIPNEPREGLEENLRARYFTLSAVNVKT